MNYLKIGENETIKTINQAINHYHNSLKNKNDNNNNNNKNQKFIIFLSSGVYSEIFDLPNNVFLIGLEKNSVIIQPPFSTISEQQCELITLNNNSQIKNITISIYDILNNNIINPETQTISVIGSRNKNKISLEQLSFTDKNYNQNSLNKSIDQKINQAKEAGIHLLNNNKFSLSTIHIIGGFSNYSKEIDFIFNNHNLTNLNQKKVTELKCLNLEATETYSQNIEIRIDNTFQNIYGFYLTNNYINAINILNARIKIQSLDNNYGIFCNSSHAHISHSTIKLIGEEEEKYNNAIKCQNLFKDNAYLSMINTNQYSHLELKINKNKRNIVDLINNDILDKGRKHGFIYFGFSEGQYIMIKNKQYKIIQVFDNEMYLDKAIPVDEKYDIDSITEIFFVDIKNCDFDTDICIYCEQEDYDLGENEYQKYNNCIEVYDIHKTYFINVNNSSLIGGHPYKSLNKSLISSSPHIITVGSSNSDFTRLSDALLEIKKFRNYHQYHYVINLQPGIYYETQDLNFSSNISLKGYSSNIAITTIELSPKCRLNLADNLSIENLTFDCHLELNESPKDNYKMLSKNHSNIIFKNILINLNSNKIQGIRFFHLENSHLKFDNLVFNINQTHNDFILFSTQLSKLKFISSHFNFKSESILDYFHNYSSDYDFISCSFDIPKHQEDNLRNIILMHIINKYQKTSKIKYRNTTLPKLEDNYKLFTYSSHTELNNIDNIDKTDLFYINCEFEVQDKSFELPDIKNNQNINTYFYNSYLVSKSSNNKLLQLDQLGNIINTHHNFNHNDINLNYLDLNTYRFKVKSEIQNESIEELSTVYEFNNPIIEQSYSGLLVSRIENQNNFELTNIYRDKKVVGVINDIKTNQIIFKGSAEILLIQETYNSSTSTRKIEYGDYITSSNFMGFGVIQDDDIQYNYTIAKTIQSLNWDNVYESLTYQNKKYKIARIKCLLI